MRFFIGKGLALVLTIAALTLSACTTSYRTHGYAPSDEQLAAVEVGRDTKESVEKALGRPSFDGIVQEDAWYYVESRFKHYAYQAPQEVEREIVRVSFSGAGRVTNIERFGLEDGRVVALSRRVTSSSVKGISFLRQLMGNFGRISADQFID